MNETTNTITCRHCGTELSADTKFCPECGKTVVGVETPAKAKNGKKKIFLIGGIIAAAVAIVTAIVLSIVFREIPVEGIVLSETKVELKAEESINISCTVYPEKATDKTVVWSSSDENIATVNSYGMIVAVAKGNCTITATCGEQTQTVDVTVKTKIDLQQLYDDFCSSTWATLGGDKSYLSVDTNPYNYDDGDYRFFYDVNDAIKKIHKSLGLPESLMEDMNHTTWSMGKQSEEYEDLGLLITWTYHPDKGLEVTYKLTNK